MEELTLKASEGLTPSHQQTIAGHAHAGSSTRVVLIADVEDPELVELVKLEIGEALMTHGMDSEAIEVRKP